MWRGKTAYLEPNSHSLDIAFQIRSFLQLILDGQYAVNKLTKQAISMQCGFLNIVKMSFPHSRHLLYLLLVTRKVQHVEEGKVYLSDALIEFIINHYLSKLFGEQPE